MDSYVFLDTELTSLEAFSEVLSIGLVPMLESAPQLYLERNDYRREVCNDFVVNTVLPLLGRTPSAACTYLDMALRLRDWSLQLGQRRHVIVCDFSMDF